VRLSAKEVAWWNDIPADQAFTCRVCGRTGTKYSVQPQYREEYALCVECISAHNRRVQEERRRMLAAGPRCVACRRRGVYIHNGTHLCKQHLQRLWAAVLRKLGPTLSLIAAADGGITLSREEILMLLSESRTNFRD
jgi:hypothetical protein